VTASTELLPVKGLFGAVIKTTGLKIDWVSIRSRAKSQTIAASDSPPKIGTG